MTESELQANLEQSVREGYAWHGPYVELVRPDEAAQAQLLAAYRVLLTEALILTASICGYSVEHLEGSYFRSLLEHGIAAGAFAAADVSDATLAALAGELGVQP